MLRATCAMPLFFPAIELNGEKYYDGGIADPIPLEKAFVDGCEKLLVVFDPAEGVCQTSWKI